MKQQPQKQQPQQQPTIRHKTKTSQLQTMNESCKCFLQNVIHALNEYQDQVPELLKTCKTFRDVDSLISNAARVICNAKTIDDFEAVIVFPPAPDTNDATNDAVVVEGLDTEEVEESMNVVKQVPKSKNKLNTKPTTPKDEVKDAWKNRGKKPHIETEDEAEAFEDQEQESSLFPSLEEFGDLRNHPKEKHGLPMFLTKVEINNVVNNELYAFFRKMNHNKVNLTSIKTFMRLLTRLNISWGSQSGHKVPKVKEIIDKNLEKLVAWVQKMITKCPKVPPMYLESLRYYTQQLQSDVEVEYIRMMKNVSDKESQSSAAKKVSQTKFYKSDKSESKVHNNVDNFLEDTGILTHPDTFLQVQASESFQETQASQAFVETQASQAFVETQVPQTLPLSLDDDGVSDGIDTKSLVLQETEASQILLPFSKQKYGTTLEELAMAYSQPEDNASPHGKKRPCPSNENNDNLLPVKYTKIV